MQFMLIFYNDESEGAEMPDLFAEMGEFGGKLAAEGKMRGGAPLRPGSEGARIRVAGIFRELVEESKEAWLYGLVAFAVMEERRIEWMQHRKTVSGDMPNADQIREWYEQQPSGTLLRAKGEAESALQLYADDVLKEIQESERRQVRESTIVSEIRLGQRFWPQLGVNIAGGLASAVLFAGLLAILAWFLLAGQPSFGEILGRDGNGEAREADQSSDE